MHNAIIFLKKAFPVKKNRIIQGMAYGALLCAINLLTPLPESVRIPIWGARMLLILWFCMAVGFLWAGKLFLNLEIVGWTVIGYTAIGVILALCSPDRFGKVLLTGLCLFVVYIIITYVRQRHDSSEADRS